MASTSAVHMYDAGVLFLITVQDESGIVNLTTVQNVQLFFQKPDRSVYGVQCQILNASTGLVQYVSTTTDFDQVGKWSVQIVVRFATDNIKHSDIGILTVMKNLA